MDRKKFFTLGAAGTLGASLFNTAETSQPSTEKRWQNGESPWPICLDTYTILPASLEEKVEIAAEAGYDAIEPWDRELISYEKEGGDVEKLGARIKELGLFVPSVIGLWNAIPPGDKEFEESLEGTRNRMRLAKAIGSQHIQTIPNTVGEGYDVKKVAQRYRTVLEIAEEEFGLEAALVFVKFFPLKSMGQAMQVALDSNHPNAKIIPDTYHMYITEGGFNGLKLINGDAIAIFQFADAPGHKAPDDLADADRVFPGDGVLPLPEILRDLYATGFRGCISLELYNPEYHQRDPLEVAKEGFEKTLKVIKEAGV
ncbi:MAG: sugar phosphate isomerase/epimerase [Balneolaceae bacterium]|nr:sugar phosphate isomerase/epimerase [Balneolaceae bacterium]MBO6545711.1 sugar phosphate isomerase/epimerase [Balneolaceae bacterium]MBO6647107.1 sugar phosphate isomerase/epimerase [Balneolaceae bacterium]